MNVIRRAELIRRALETESAVIVVSNFALVCSLKIDHNIEAITFQQFLNGALSGRNVAVFIDDIDMLLHRIAGYSVVDTITVTTNSE